MRVKIYVPDIECDSCVRVISKAFRKEESIHSFTFHDDNVDVDFDEGRIRKTEIVNLIKKLSFRAGFEPFDRKSFKERARHYKENKHKYKIETKVFSYSLIVFMVLLVLETFTYSTFLNKIPDFLVNYGWWILYLNISVVVLGMGIWHVYSYKYKMTCMLGMMVGMTIGMQSGMMIGAVIGATNGFFVGSMAGMLLGTFVGAVTGKGCGIMGVIEGMMAGVMGGTMGAMITVMMFSDHVLWFMPFYMAINVAIVWGMSYMLYEEVVEDNEKTVPTPIDFTTISLGMVIVNFVLLGLMIFGPKSAFIGF